MARLVVGVGILALGPLTGFQRRRLERSAPEAPALVVTGVVTDAAGQPIVRAHIDHTGNGHKVYETDVQGRFAVNTAAPAIVIRKAGFRSAFVRGPEGALRITLQKLEGGERFPVCAAKARTQGLPGWGSHFRFPLSKQVKASKLGRDIDYAARSYFVGGAREGRAIRHGRGMMWTFGDPSENDVWRSVEYQESMWELGSGNWVVDARGKMASGARWRYLGTFGESASYSGVDEATAAVLDGFMDAACMLGAGGPARKFGGLGDNDPPRVGN